MQTKVLTCLAALMFLASCMELGAPYEGKLNNLSVVAQYPDGYSPRAGASVSIENVSGEGSYKLLTDASGKASTTLPDGLYRISVHDRDGSSVFNGTLDKVVVTGGDVNVTLPLLYSKAGSIVIKELYCGGCSKVPEEGTYQADQYLIIHNNDTEPRMLDGLCLGTLSPYNSNASNPWADAEGNLPAFLPVIQAVWMIGGSGSTFPLAPGEDAVICLRGAIDHASRYPMSVNLNQPGYFVCYNPVYFPNTLFHPVPGDKIEEARYLEVVIKTGQANAYTFSLNSPAVVLFRAEGVDIHDFVAVADNLIQVPGGTDRVVAIPAEWVVDALEVFNGGSSDNRKRLPASLDAGYVTLSETFKGKTLMRHTDEVASESAGFEILQDTNNSTIDFYERETQSLHP